MTMGMSQIATTFILCVVLWTQLGCGEAANDFLKFKWRTSFLYFDQDKDEMVSMKDVINVRERYVKLGHLEGTQKAKVEEDFKKWWQEYLLWGEDKISVDEHVKRNDAAFTAGEVKFIKRVRLYEEILCNLNDISGDGYISINEMVEFSKAVGHSNEELDMQFFHNLNPVDNKVAVADMINYWTHFLTSEESSETDLIQNAFDGGI